MLRSRRTNGRKIRARKVGIPAPDMRQAAICARIDISRPRPQDGIEIVRGDLQIADVERQNAPIEMRIDIIGVAIQATV